MSDAELLCEFMRPKPEVAPEYYRAQGDLANDGWWRVAYQDAGVNAWVPVILTLDRLYEIETKLIGLGLRAKIDNALSQEVWRTATEASTWHATPEQKIKALALVTRGV